MEEKRELHENEDKLTLQVILKMMHTSLTLIAPLLLDIEK